MVLVLGNGRLDSTSRVPVTSPQTDTADENRALMAWLLKGCPARRRHHECHTAQVSVTPVGTEKSVTEAATIFIGEDPLVKTLGRQ